MKSQIHVIHFPSALRQVFVEKKKLAKLRVTFSASKCTEIFTTDYCDSAVLWLDCLRPVWPLTALIQNRLVSRWVICTPVSHWPSWSWLNRGVSFIWLRIQTYYVTRVSIELPSLKKQKQQQPDMETLKHVHGIHGWISQCCGPFFQVTELCGKGEVMPAISTNKKGKGNSIWMKIEHVSFIKIQTQRPLIQKKKK